MPGKFRWMSILLLAFLHASFPAATCAQEPSSGLPAPLRLTLKDAVQLALKQNPQRVIARILISESERNSQIARAAWRRATIDDAVGQLRLDPNVISLGPPRFWPAMMVERFTTPVIVAAGGKRM
jgi:hypothetical protein